MMAMRTVTFLMMKRSVLFSTYVVVRQARVAVALFIYKCKTSSFFNVLHR